MDHVQSIKETLFKNLAEAAEAAREKGMFDYQDLPDFTVEVPREKEHGDFAANLAMLLAKQAKKSPREIAAIILQQFEKQETWVSEISVAGPGFINFKLDEAWLYKVLPTVLEEDKSYGHTDKGQGEKVQVEFVSANPTGLLHMGNARGAALGDSIANLLSATGYDVSREFYINDAGNQITNFSKSLEARYLQQLGKDVPFPDEGYHGQDLVDTVKRFIAKEGDKYLDVSPELRQEMLVEFALEEKITVIRETLERFGVKYDVWFSERTLHESGAIENAVSELQQKGLIYKQEEALWFKSTEFGDEKDEVVVRKNGMPTYFAADIAYHKNKFERGFKWVINVWGADHHGHIARMKGAAEALGYDPDKLDVVLMQLVRLYQGGEALRMSKRTGTYITLDELIEEVGVDAARYFFVMRSTDSHLEFDLDLAKSQSSDNPVYYVQYAHARICSILEQAKEAVGTVRASAPNFNVLKEAEELELIRRIADFPGVVSGAAEALEPHRLTTYAGQLASQFHSFYTKCRVLTDEEEIKTARLQLVDATRVTLRNLLGMLGVSAPESM